MSNSLAIAAVTATLRGLLERRINADPTVDPSSDPALAGTVVTARPPDEAASRDHARQLNLFLYQINPNAAWRNRDMPRQTRPGESGQPPLPLILHYLFTAYVRDDNEDSAFLSHRMLGRAMSILHDHPVLGAAEVRSALDGNDLHLQVERVRLTLLPLSLDEVSKLWTAFQGQYRLSAVYEASVVLIESNREVRTPLPVLRRGEEDQGILSQPDLVPPYPTLTGIGFPNNQPAARLNDRLILTGYQLDGTSVSVLFRHPRLDDVVSVSPEAGGTATELTVVVPGQPDDFPVGFYTLAVQLTRAGETFSRTSNELSFALMPEGMPLNVTRSGNAITIELAVTPTILPEQRVALLLGSREIVAQPHPTPTRHLRFIAVDDPSGKFAAGESFYFRLRVDGVDSLLIDFQAQPPQFDQSQRITLP